MGPKALSVVQTVRLTKNEAVVLQKSGEFPDEPVRIKGSQIHDVTSQTY
jgi:hypothetical protein